jgi:RNA recognition motif-containing protein
MWETSPTVRLRLNSTIYLLEMPNRDDGQSAINDLNGSEVRGRNLKVSEARPKKNDRGYGGGRSYGSR